MTSPPPRSGPPRPGRYTKYPAKPVYRGAPAQGCGAEYRRHRAPISLPRGSGPPATELQLWRSCLSACPDAPLDTALDFECRPLQLLCFGVPPLPEKRSSQAVHRQQCLRVLQPEDAALSIKRLPLQFLCFRVMALGEKRPGEMLVER